jgi:ankyrin repeat protein
MKYIKLFEAFKHHDPYELMMIPSYKKAEMIASECRKVGFDAANLDLVSDLIALGADLDWRDRGNNTLLHIAVFHRRPKIVRMLIDAGAKLDVQDDNGWTPLYVSTFNSNPEIARMLVEAGARRDIPDEDGRLPYDRAVGLTMQLLLHPLK